MKAHTGNVAGPPGEVVSDDTRMTTPAPEMYRRIDEAVVDMINEFRIQRATGPLPDKALDQIVFGQSIPSSRSSAPTLATSATSYGRACFACSSPPSFAR